MNSFSTADCNFADSCSTVISCFCVDTIFNLFPVRNITRKGHVLSFHIPEYMKKYRTYYQYYALEKAGEPIHAKMNKLMRRFSPIRPKEERQWRIVEEYEKQNGINKESIKARKRNPNIPFFAKASLGQLLLIFISSS